MTTRVLEKKVASLEREVGLIRSLVISRLAKDPEGEYRPAFVRRILKATKEKPEYEFKDAKSFLRLIRGK